VVVIFFVWAIEKYFSAIPCGGGDAAARPLLRGGGGSEEFRGDPTVWPHLRSAPQVKNGRSAKDGAPERLRRGTIQKVVN